MKLIMLFAALAIAHWADAAPSSTGAQLTVSVTYMGSHVLDQDHRICVGLLRQREIAHPVALQLADENTHTVVFQNVQISPVLALAAILAPSHCADKGVPLPAGSVFGFYGRSGQAQPVPLKSGNPTHINIDLNDSHLFEESRPAKLARLQDPSLPGAPSVVYSPAYENRARRLQETIRDEFRFFEQEFRIRLRPITLAVLDSTQWSHLIDLPYGVPNESARVIAMPASWNDTHIFPLPSKPPANRLVKLAMATGRSWTSLVYEGADGTLAHEVGHLIFPQLGIYTTTNWFEEFMASYLGYAYLMAKRPEEILANKVFWLVGLDGAHPRTSLADLESHEASLSRENLNWYECALEQRVIKVYRQKGMAFIREVQKTFPVTGPDMTGEQTLDKLETVSPGWRKWAKEMKADRIKSAN